MAQRVAVIGAVELQTILCWWNWRGSGPKWHRINSKQVLQKLTLSACLLQLTTRVVRVARLEGRVAGLQGRVRAPRHGEHRR